MRNLIKTLAIISLEISQVIHHLKNIDVLDKCTSVKEKCYGQIMHRTLQKYFKCNHEKAYFIEKVLEGRNCRDVKKIQKKPLNKLLLWDV